MVRNVGLEQSEPAEGYIVKDIGRGVHGEHQDQVGDVGSVRQAEVECFEGKGDAKLDDEVCCRGRDVGIVLCVVHKLLKVYGRRDGNHGLVQLSVLQRGANSGGTYLRSSVLHNASVNSKILYSQRHRKAANV